MAVPQLALAQLCLELLLIKRFVDVKEGKAHQDYM